jgi:hypothetical protein
MAELENTVSSEEAMVVENQPDTNAEVPAEQLMQGTETGEATEQQTEEQPAEQEQQAGNAYAEGLQTLYDDGWTHESINALITDPQALRDMRDGRTVRQAAFAFMQRQSASAKPAAKKGVPTFRTAATSGAKDVNKIEEMSSAEFAEFSKRAKEALMSGKLVTFK